MALIAGFAWTTLSLGANDPVIHDLPYQPSVSALIQVDAEADAAAVKWADLDGDGFEDMVSCQHFSVLCFRGGAERPRILWQHPVPPPFDSVRPVAAVCAEFDLEGDGEPDVVVATRTADGWTTRIEVLDWRTGREKSRCELAGISDRRTDGIWDGRYIPVFGVPRADGSGDDLALVAYVNWDADGRGVHVIDPRTGDPVWTFLCGPKLSVLPPIRGDLDGDGRDEYVITGAAVGNLSGDNVGHTSDDSCRVFVLRQTGELMWQRALAGQPSSCEARVADLDRDGQLEVVALINLFGEEESRLVVLGGRSGSVVAERLVAAAADVLVVPPGDRRPRPTILLTLPARGRVLRLDLSPNGGLDTLDDPAVPLPLPLSLRLGDLVGDPTPEIIVYSRDGYLLCDCELVALAFVPESGAVPSHGWSHAWRLSESVRVLAGSNLSANMYSFSPTLRSFPWPLASASAAVLVLAGATLFLARRRKPADDAAVLRELRQQLLRRLQVVRHEKFGTLENIERLIWYLEAAQVSAVSNETLPAPVTTLITDTRDSTVVRLKDIASLARRVGVRDVHAAVLEDASDECVQLLTRLSSPANHIDLPGALQDLREIQESLKLASRRIRQDVERFFTVDLAATVHGVLRAQSQAITDGQITVVNQPTTAATEPLLAIGDRDDISFIIDNLVGNAIRAMTNMAHCELTICWEVSVTTIRLRISDSGCGIPPDDWERVLTGDGSSRAGGGFGFAHTRELLPLYRGQVWIEASEPGRGTTVVLSLRRTDRMNLS